MNKNISVNQYLKDAYKVGYQISFKNRHKGLLYAMDQFLKEYSQKGLNRYFEGSKKQLYLTIDELTQPFSNVVY